MSKNLSLNMSSPILDSILATHGHADNSFSVDPLLKIVHSIINRSTHVADRIVQGNQVQEESMDKISSSGNIRVPFCTLKAISCELSVCSCKLAGEVSGNVAHDSTLLILNKLSNYSWDAKAVLTLAAFALDYGEFWHLAQPPSQSDQLLTKPLAILKGVEVLLKKPINLSQHHRQAIGKLNGLIRKTLQVVELIYKAEELSDAHTRDVPELAKIMKRIPEAVYWAIRTTLACVTSITIFITKDDDDKSAGDVELVISSVQKNIKRMFDGLSSDLKHCHTKIEAIEIYALLHKHFHQTPFRIKEVLRAMIFGKNFEPTNKVEPQTLVDFDGLEAKKVVWFISSIDVTDDYIEAVIPNNEANKGGIDQYGIVWIPIVDEWTDKAKEKFDQIMAKSKLWYALKYSSPIAVSRFVNVDWHYNGKPMVVVTGHQGEVEYQDYIFPSISIWVKITDPKYPEWFLPFVNHIEANFESWIKKGNYIFFYGGKNKTWIEGFEKKAKTFCKELTNHEIKLASLITSKLAGQFWSIVESLFLSNIKIINNQPLDQHVNFLRELEKLLCYKNEDGWVMLFKGLTVVTSGRGSTMLEVLENFGEWKGQLAKNNFESAFKEYHHKVIKDSHHCNRLDIENVNEKDIPNNAVLCPDCSRVMGRYLSFQCCRGN